MRKSIYYERIALCKTEQELTKLVKQIERD